MPITAYPPGLNDRTSASGLKLVEASGLQVPSPNAVRPAPVPLPAPTEKVHLHKASKELSDAAQAEISRLKARDAQMRQHEQAHLSAAAGLDVSSASFTYQRGPNGVNYAVAGDVRIDTSAGHTPEETLARAEQIQDVALAPADPTAIDRSVAAKAQNMAMQARIELMQQEHQAHAAKPAEQQNNIKQAYGGSSTSPSTPHINTYV